MYICIIEQTLIYFCVPGLKPLPNSLNPQNILFEVVTPRYFTDEKKCDTQWLRNLPKVKDVKLAELEFETKRSSFWVYPMLSNMVAMSHIRFFKFKLNKNYNSAPPCTSHRHSDATYSSGQQNWTMQMGDLHHCRKPHWKHCLCCQTMLSCCLSERGSRPHSPISKLCPNLIKHNTNGLSNWDSLMPTL